MDRSQLKAWAQQQLDAIVPIPQRKPEMKAALARVYEKYPRLKGYGFEASRSNAPSRGRYLEFYPPNEDWNPRPGVPFMEVYDSGLVGDYLTRALAGDALHYLPRVDPTYAQMREQFRSTITPEQNAVDRAAYRRAQDQYGEARSFDQWFETSRLDAYLRGYLTPDRNDEWRNIYTPQQRAMLGNIDKYLRGQE